VRKNYTIKVVLIKLYMYVEVFVYLQTHTIESNSSDESLANG